MEFGLTHLFVYGTLLSHNNHPMAKYLRTNAKLVSKAYAYGSLYKIDLFPAFIPDGSKNKVFGEVFEIENSSLIFKTLDSYEGYDPLNNRGEFLRNKQHVFLLDGTSKECWTYVYNKEVNPKSKIISGDFIKLNTEPF